MKTIIAGSRTEKRFGPLVAAILKSNFAPISEVISGCADGIDQLGEESTWDDLIEAIVVRLAIDAGIRDFEQGRTISHEEVLRRVDRAP